MVIERVKTVKVVETGGIEGMVKGGITQGKIERIEPSTDAAGLAISGLPVLTRTSHKVVGQTGDFSPDFKNISLFC